MQCTYPAAQPHQQVLPPACAYSPVPVLRTATMPITSSPSQRHLGIRCSPYQGTICVQSKRNSEIHVVVCKFIQSRLFCLICRYTMAEILAIRQKTQNNINQSINQSINLSINQSIYQSINQSLSYYIFEGGLN